MRLKPFRWYSLQELCCLFILIAVGSVLLIGISNQYLTERHSFHDFLEAASKRSRVTTLDCNRNSFEKGNSSLTYSRRLSNRDMASNIHQLDRRKNCIDSSCNSNISVYLEIIPESSIMRNSNNMVVSKRELTNPLSCSGDPVKFPFLDRLYIDPPVNFKPNLNLSEVMEYYATVPYETIVIAIQGVAKHCYAEARLTDKHGSSRLSNYTLGLGLNEVVIKVVDRRTVEDPSVLNTYTLHVYRQNAAENQTEFDDKKPHQTCYLAQDCGLWYMSNERCGLQPSEHVSWARYVEFASRLKPCVSGSASGRWMVPCLDCRHNRSCFWKEAVWQPHDCNHVVSSRQELRQCLSKRKVLFIGDSTNRGMMHYMMEQVNGSLMESDKTHDSKVYTNINDNRTIMSFAYYPQFWMPSGQRPVLTDALNQLLAMTMPLENNGRTVLVVGGVHWLAIQHLYLISDILHRSGLSNILVIIKTLGSGFHQTVEGLHHLTLEDQRVLAVHNSVLIQHATSLGFEVIDTFNMTMARYRDFLPGKCACHFHRVKEVLPSFMQFLQHSSNSSASQVPLSDMPIKYHVGGDINAIYSEILINIICRNR